ncbi:MAG: hypothetical protein QOE63_1937 [Acidimicrobiaceae bacterium]
MTIGRGASVDGLRIVFNAWRDVAHPLSGGSEVMIDRLAAGLSARGHEITLRTARPIGAHSYDIVEAGGRLSQFARWPLAYALHHRNADLVVDVANGMTFFTPLVRSGPTVCLVHHIHELHWAQWFSPPVAAFGRTLEREAMPRVYRRNLFVAVSRSTASELASLGVDPARIRIVHNGVDVPVQHATEAPEPLFVAVSRLVPHKRFDLLLEAWRRVQPHTGGRLVVAGDGPERARLERMHVPNVELVGRVSEAEKDRLMGEAWLFLHTSEVEGWGLVIMEAAARSTPTLALRTLGVRDSVLHDATGWLADDVDGLVAAWVALAADATRRRSMGRAARERARRFTWDQSVVGFEEVAREATATRSARSTSTRRTSMPAVIHLREAPPRRVHLVADTTPGRAFDVTLIVRAPHGDANVRRVVATWRDALGGASTELVVLPAQRDGDASTSSLLVDALLSGFEAAVSATEVDGESTVAVAGAVVVLLDAARPAHALDVLAAVPDVRGAALARVEGTIAIGAGDGTWDGRALALLAGSDDSSLARLVAVLGHFDLEVGRPGGLIAGDLTAISHRANVVAGAAAAVGGEDAARS